jgi:hypothetical protein
MRWSNFVAILVYVYLMQDDEYLASLQADREKELKAIEEAEAAREEERRRAEESHKKLQEERVIINLYLIAWFFLIAPWIYWPIQILSNSFS